MSKILTKSLIGSPDVSYSDAPLVSVPFSSVANRAKIRDLSKDMAPLFGINRIPVQQIIELQNESGPNGERVHAPLYDTDGLIRFVGDWTNANAANGPRIETSALTTDYVEITFYGTALNILMGLIGTGYNIVASIDGGPEGSNLVVTTGSSALAGRNYSPNVVVPIVSGLSLGIHTVKIRQAVASSLPFYGYEVINEVAQVSVVQGSIVRKQSRAGLESAISLSYKPSDLTGTRGGRVVLYSTGSKIATAVQPVDSVSKYLTNADHANEVLIRTHYPREFGAGRSDDFSTMTSSQSDRAFTLSDGTTNLLAYQSSIQTRNSMDALVAMTTSTFWTVTFVGTGLDIKAANNSAGTANYTLWVDGVNQGTVAGGSTSVRTIKLCSGLPYGTHTVQIVNNVGNAAELDLFAFNVYGPKKPETPAGAVELADYCVMADYSISTNGNTNSISQGVLRKNATREMLYSGTWSFTSDPTLTSTGYYVGSTTAGSYVEYTFFGTGVEWVFKTNSALAHNLTISIDGSSNLSGYTTQYVAASTGTTFTASTGTLTGTSAGQGHAQISIRGLTLGLHKIRVTQNTTTNTCTHEAFDVIVPIHSMVDAKTSFQSTSLVGSCSMLDSRILSTSQKSKLLAIANGIANYTTTTTVGMPVQDLGLVIKTDGGRFLIKYDVITHHNIAGGATITSLYINGIRYGAPRVLEHDAAGRPRQVEDTFVVDLPAGSFKIDVYISTGSGTLSVYQDERKLIVVEL
jgi:hypothetical protein